MSKGYNIANRPILESLVLALSSSVTYTAERTVLPLQAYALEAPLEIPKDPVIATTSPKIGPVYDPIAFNCWKYVKSKIPSFPNTRDLVPNSLYPIAGGVVKLDYNGTPHWALTPLPIKEGKVFLDESNFKRGEYTQRWVSLEYLTERSAEYWIP